MAHLIPKQLGVALCAVFMTSMTHAEVVTTDDVTVSAGAITEHAPATTTVSRARIDREMIRDMRDLARYEQDFGLREEGRYSKGFAMRGVEGNRVGILIDGMSLPDSEENTLYARYGKMNSSRPTVDTELVSSISIDRGSNSVQTGSGAIGGSVGFRTLNAQDIVEDGNTFGGLGRIGYATKNREWTKTVSGAWNTDSVSALLLYSHRHGHELESNGRGIEDRGSKSQHPDPEVHNSHSYLGKFRYYLNEAHSLGLNLNGTHYERTQQLHTREKSDEYLVGTDTTKRNTATLDYTYAPYGEVLNKVKVSGEYSKIDTIADTDTYDNRYWTESYTETGETKIVRAVQCPYLDRPDVCYYPYGYLRKNENRKFETQFYRLQAEAESAPIEFYGEHNFGARLYTSLSRFKNINVDSKPLNEFPPFEYSPDTYTIQRPADTLNTGIVLSDDIFYEPELFEGHDSVVGVHLGARLERTGIHIKSFNAKCTEGCLAVPDDVVIENKAYLNHAFSLGVDVEVDRKIKAGYSLSTGFRNPSSTELFFHFDNRTMGAWYPNPNLKPEKSLTHNLFLQIDHKVGTLNLNTYYTRYKDFLFEDEDKVRTGACYNFGDRIWCPTKPRNFMVNLEKASIYGIEAGGTFNMDTLDDTLKGFKLMGSLGYTKGKTSNGLSLLSIQPMKVVTGLDYEDPQKRFGLYARATYTAGKKPKDTLHRNLFDPVRDANGRPIEVNGQEVYKITPRKYVTKGATVFDIYGWYSPKKNVTVRAGVYNLTNKRYKHWDSVRGITPYSGVNVVDRQGLGLERFYAPGRNYNVTLEVKF